MLYKCVFPVKTTLLLNENWPITIADMKLEWIIENGIIEAISMTAPMLPNDILPKLVLAEGDGALPEVHFGDSGQHERMEQALRTLQGTLAIFAHIEIDFDQVKVVWVPEVKGEEQKLAISSYTRMKEHGDIDQPRPLHFEMVARATLAINDLRHFEVPLEFLRRGVLDLEAGRYFESFYSFFFFLETLYAPGFSDPKKVRAKLLGSQELIECLTKARGQLRSSPHRNREKLQRLLQMSDEQLIGHIVTVRGNLHHHALPRPGMWHPGKPDEFMDEVILLRYITNGIAVANVVPVLYSDPSRKNLLIKNAETAEAILTFQVIGLAVENGAEHRVNLGRFKIPGKKITKQIINHINLIARNNFIGNPNVANLIGYKIMSLDEHEVYAVYELD